MAHQSPTYIWEKVNQYYQTTRKSIHVAVAYTADAAAASLTLSSLLKASLILYEIQPVATTEELREMIVNANRAQEDARSSQADPLVDEFFLLVGIGGAIPLQDYFDLQHRHIVVVLDSYRPFHLSNLRGQDDDERLLLWGRDTIHEEVAAFFRGQQLAAALQRRRRRRRTAQRRRKRLRRQYEVDHHEGGGRYDAEEDDDGEDDGDSSEEGSESSSDEDDEDDDEDSSSSLSISQNEEPIDWTDPTELPPYLETAYYACERAGRSCAVEAHELAVLLGRFRDATLWHAAVGVCDLFQRRLIDYAAYLVEMHPLHDAVTLQKSIRRGGEHRGIGLEEDDESPAGGESGADPASASSHLMRSGSNAMELHNRHEEQLYLLRHTSLWDAIWHHPVTASVLRLHHVDDGEGLLRQLLARCGVSALMAQQPWCEVPQADRAGALRLVQRELRQVIESRARHLTYPNEIRCVSRSCGFSVEVSTFDACFLHEALLAAVPPPSVTTLEANFAEDSAAAKRLVADRLRRFHCQRFWMAYSILDMDASACEFADAVQEATILQGAIADATGALMQPGMLQSTAGLHYVVPSDPRRTTTALESFSTVYRLNALARRLLLTLTVERGLGRYTHAVRPLLVSCALPIPVREEADPTFMGFSGARSGAPSILSEASVNTLPFNVAATEAGKTATATTDTGARAGGGAAALDTMLSAATAAAMGGGGGGGGGGGVAGGDEHEFLVLLTHEGGGGTAMTPIPSVGRFISFIHDPEEFDALPQQRYPAQRTAVVVGDRATAAHLADAMYLSCLSTKWDPQRETAP